MERLNFGFEQHSLRPQVEMPLSMYDERGLRQLSDSLMNRGDDSPLIVHKSDESVTFVFNLTGLAWPKINPAKQRTLSIINHVQRVAGDDRQDPQFRCLSKLWPDEKGRFGLKVGLVWPNRSPQELSLIATHRMQQAKFDLRWGIDALDDVGCVAEKDMNAVLFTDPNKKHGEVANRTQSLHTKGKILNNVGLVAENLRSLDQVFICLVGALAIAKAEQLPREEILGKIPQ